MKIAIVTDTHFGARNDSQLFLDHFSDFFREQFFPAVRRHGVEAIMHCGDLLDRRKYVNFNTLSVLRESFIKPIEEMGMETHIILGNHDTYYKNTNDLNSISELFADTMDNFIIHEKPSVIDLDGFNIALLPWVNKENKQESMDFINTANAQWLVGHLELEGYEVLRGIRYDGGMDPSIFNRYEQVLSGHFHCKQERGNIIYLGAPYQMTFSDTDETKGFWILDTDTRELEYIENKNEMFHKLVYDDSKNDYSKFISKKHSKYRYCYVKIYVINKDKPFILDKVVDSLYNSGVYDLTIVEDFDKIAEESEELKNEDLSKSTLELIYDEVDCMEGLDDSSRIKNLIQEIYLESLTE